MAVVAVAAVVVALAVVGVGVLGLGQRNTQITIASPAPVPTQPSVEPTTGPPPSMPADPTTSQPAPAPQPSASSSAPPGGQPSSSTRSATGTQPAPTPAHPSAPPSSRPSAITYRCWNGKVQSSLSKCSNPSSTTDEDEALEALNWTFKSRGKRLEGAQCQSKSAPKNRIIHRNCVTTYRGSSVCMNYSLWTSTAAAIDDYDLLGAPESTTNPDGTTLLVWGPSAASHNCDGLAYKTAKMIKGERWGLTVYADSSSTARAALAHFGEFRSHDQWRGVKR